MTVKEVRVDIDKVVEAIAAAAEHTGYSDFNALECDYSEENPNEIQELNEIYHFMDTVTQAAERLLYLRKPITHEGTISYTPRGKLAIITGNEEAIELDGGQRVEILQYDDINNRNEWILTETSRATAANGSIVDRGIVVGGMTQARIRD